MSGSPADQRSAHNGLYRYNYRRSADQDRRDIAHHEVVVVGAGPVGLTVALDLGLRGIAVVLLDDADRIGVGSRGICYAKRTLEILDRLGVGEQLIAKGLTWNLGEVYLGERLVYAFDLLPEDGHKMPAFINLQQFYLEKALVEAVEQVTCIDLRWNNRVSELAQYADQVAITIETPEGPYRLEAEWLIAADGARSTVRELAGLGFKGLTFEDKFLIADVRMAADFPTVRRFWFDPRFHAGQSALMHRQPDNVWRIDLQLGPHANIEEEQKPEAVVRRLQAMLGELKFELEWVSIYQFNCRRLERFVHDRVIFVGDAAHQVSPFGARGANSGIQDAENLAWKLAAVLQGEADGAFLETYNIERVQAAEENIGHSTRSTDFIAPRSPAERRLRNAVLKLAPRAEFAQRMINSGRLSTPTVYASALSTPDAETFAGSAHIGAPLPDAPMRAHGQPGFLLERLSGSFEVLYVDDGARPALPAAIKLTIVGKDLIDDTGVFGQRFDARPGSTYLIRPDQHLTARFRSFDAGKLRKAVARALGKSPCRS